MKSDTPDGATVVSILECVDAVLTSIGTHETHARNFTLVDHLDTIKSVYFKHVVGTYHLWNMICACYMNILALSLK